MRYSYDHVLAAGDKDSIILYLITQVDADPDISDWYNYAEISEADDDDIEDNTPPTDADSNPDNVQDDNNDTLEPNSDDDDEIHENGLDGEDEDDHDVEKIIVGYDLALNKQVLESTPYSYGDLLTYRITIYNQGGLVVSDIEIEDYLPCGLVFDASLNDGWTEVGDNVSTIITSQLFPGGETFVDLKLIVQRCDIPASDNYFNAAEITDFQDEDGNEPIQEDYDSTPDDDPNDDDVVDDELGGPGDEDDHDVEDIIICDLALNQFHCYAT